MKHRFCLFIAIISLISCASSEANNNPFEWISIYSPSAKDSSMPDISMAHHVDTQWELWGHNLHKQLGDIKEAHALIDGVRTDEQLCFSSPALLKATEDYITSNFGKGKSGSPARITIMPDDNAMVCTCEACKKAGNSSSNATPAVTIFLEKLAKKFPNHLFFTSAYLSTVKAPSRRLPGNVGVFLSAIDMPLRTKFRETRGFREFDSLLNEWRAVCSRIYVWDYSRNFDDYLTPFPCLKLSKERLLYYKANGVKGVFFNGSGDDYSSFDDLQTYVLLHLLINPDADVEALLSEYVQRVYPLSGESIKDYLLSLEEEAVNRDHRLQFYGGIRDAEHSFLNAKAFEDFWVSLDRKSKNIQGDERKRLNTLLTALNFTRLELLRTRKHLDKNAVADAMEVMSYYAESPSLRNYREANGSLEEYIKVWQTQPMKVEREDLLLGCRLQADNINNEEADVTMLTDGLYGMPTDYHSNWLISGSNEWKVSATSLPNPHGTVSSLDLGFLLAPRWRMFLPSSIVVMCGDKEVGCYTIADEDQITDKSVFKRETISIPLTVSPEASSAASREAYSIILRRSGVNPRATIACDEIELR